MCGAYVLRFSFGSLLITRNRQITCQFCGVFGVCECAPPAVPPVCSITVFQPTGKGDFSTISYHMYECLCVRVRLLWILQKVFRSKRQGSPMLPGNVLIYGACLGLAPLSDRQCVTLFRHPDLSAMILSSSRMNACECGSLIWNISVIAFISALSGCCEAGCFVH